MSSDRKTCKHFGVCGGCQFQNIPYEEQVIEKEKNTKKLLNAVISEQLWEDTVRSSNIWEYRSKMEYSFGGNLDRTLLGLHTKIISSNETEILGGVFRVDECPLFSGSAGKFLKIISDWTETHGFVSYSTRKHTGFLRHCIIREAKHTKQIMIILVHSSLYPIDTYEACRAHLAEKLKEAGVNTFIDVENDAQGDVVTYGNETVLFGSGYIGEYLNTGVFEKNKFIPDGKKLEFRIRPETFWQANSLMIPELYGVACEYLAPKKDDIVLDLYCGVGSISLFISSLVGRVVGMEIVHESVNQARQAALLNGISNVQFHVGAIENDMEKIDLSNISKIIVDPPRVGVHKKAISAINTSTANRLVYISCKPTSLLNDLPLFFEGGWRAEKARMIDMFPHTEHAEVVVSLVR